MVVRIHFQNMQIDRISSTSGVFSGHNVRTRWKNMTKQNEGFGTVNEEQNVIKGNSQMVFDRDVMERMFRELTKS